MVAETKSVSQLAKTKFAKTKFNEESVVSSEISQQPFKDALHLFLTFGKAGSSHHSWLLNSAITRRYL